LACKLQDSSTLFRKAQSKYLKRLQKIETVPTIDFKNEPDNEDLDIVFKDAQMALVHSNDHAITQREQEINEIAKSIMTISDIFRELQTMVLFIY
jgi:syntaxin 16